MSSNSYVEFSCDICGKLFSTENGILAHIKVAHPEAASQLAEEVPMPSWAALLLKMFPDFPLTKAKALAFDQSLMDKSQNRGVITPFQEPQFERELRNIQQHPDEETRRMRLRVIERIISYCIEVKDGVWDAQWGLFTTQWEQLAQTFNTQNRPLTQYADLNPPSKMYNTDTGRHRVIMHEPLTAKACMELLFLDECPTDIEPYLTEKLIAWINLVYCRLSVITDIPSDRREDSTQSFNNRLKVQHGEWSSLRKITVPLLDIALHSISDNALYVATTPDFTPFLTAALDGQTIAQPQEPPGTQEWHLHYAALFEDPLSQESLEYFRKNLHKVHIKINEANTVLSNIDVEPIRQECLDQLRNQHKLVHWTVD